MAKKVERLLSQIEYAYLLNQVSLILSYCFLGSIVLLDNIKMTSDSVNRIGNVAEGAEGKHVLAYILNRLESKWLESLAKERYKTSDVRSLYSE